MEIAGPQSEYSWPLPEYPSEANSVHDCELSNKTRLCDACSTATSMVQFGNQNWSRQHIFGAKWSSIQTNAMKRSCGICYILTQRMKRKSLSVFSDEEDLFYWWKHDSASETTILEFLYSEDKFISFFLMSIKDAQVEIASIRPSRTTNSSTSMEICRQWLKNCTENHPRCEKRHEAQSSAPFVPTRLIHLGDREHIVQPRLVQTAAVATSIRIRYCTLSHCWGAEPTRILQLTKKSLQEMQKRILTAQLSLVFREAMEAAKRLGFDYIWIDSLCILQDDRHDWRREAAKMGDTYANSGLNLAATKSADGKGGCWSSRHEFDGIPCRLDLLKPGSSSEPETYFCYTPSSWLDSISHSVLISRGWVTQEIFLSRRVLHFAQDQLFWECNTLRANEMFPRGAPPDNGVKKGLAFHYDFPSDDVDRTDAKYRAWDDIVSNFSSTNLTYPRKDKLLALDSIAKKLELNDQLIAGLWLSRLPQQLLWKRLNREFGDEDDHLAYQAPSWSWASLNVAVQHDSLDPYRREPKIYSLTVNEARVVHEENDPRAPLISGFLDVLAPVMKIPLTDPPLSKSSAIVFQFDRDLWMSFVLQFDRKCTIDSYHTLDSLHLLWVCAITKGQIEFIQGLALIPVENYTGHYKRVGIFSTHSEKPGIIYTAFTRAEEGGDIPNRGVDRSRVDGIPRYSIRLI